MNTSPTILDFAFSALGTILGGIFVANSIGLSGMNEIKFGLGLYLVLLGAFCLFVRNGQEDDR